MDPAFRTGMGSGPAFLADQHILLTEGGRERAPPGPAVLPPPHIIRPPSAGSHGRIRRKIDNKLHNVTIYATMDKK